jgi:2-keto-4-pentenoate hydratase
VTDLATIAAALQEAYATQVPIAPLTASHPGLSLDDAYAIQLIQVHRRVAAGATVVGFKVGLTSEAMRRQLGVHEPDFGHLLSDMAHTGDGPIRAAGYLQPRVEPEVALVLAKPLCDRGLTADDVAAATAYALPAIEVIDSRIANWRIGLLDTVADNGSSGGFVLGRVPVPLHRFDPATVRCVFEQNGTTAGIGAGAAVLGSPLNAAAWLADELIGRGVTLEVGHVILTGSVTAAVPVGPGDTVTATFDHLGEVTASFE